MSCVYLHWASKYNRGNTSWLWGIARFTWIKRKLGDTGRRKANICSGCWAVNTIDADHTGWLRRGQGLRCLEGNGLRMWGEFSHPVTLVIFFFFSNFGKYWKAWAGSWKTKVVLLVTVRLPLRQPVCAEEKRPRWRSFPLVPMPICYDWFLKVTRWLASTFLYKESSFLFWC